MVTDEAFEFIPFTDTDWLGYAGATKFANGAPPVLSPIYVLMEDGAYDAVVIIDQPDKLDRPGDWPSKTTGELYHVTIHFEEEGAVHHLDGGCFTYTCDASWFTPTQFAGKMERLFRSMADDADADDRILVTAEQLLARGFHFTK